MDKIKVVIEYIDENEPGKVSVMEFEEETKTILSPMEVCSNGEAFEKYIVVGEIKNGEVKYLDGDSYHDEFDYEAYSGISLEEE